MIDQLDWIDLLDSWIYAKKLLFSLTETAGVNDADGWSFIWKTAVGTKTLLLLIVKISHKDTCHGDDGKTEIFQYGT